MSVEAGVNKWIVAGTVMTGTMMAVLDSSIVNVALPDMAGTLGASIEEIAWVVTGYILSNVIIMPILGTLAEQIGRKRMYQAAVVLFTLASMLCGLARSLEVIVVFRVLQGLGGGVLMTVSQAILRESFPTEEQGMAMGVYGMGVVIAPAIGPTLGGWITDTYSWPWVFYINLPIGILNFVLVQRFIHDPAFLERKRGGMDWTGIALLAVGLGALQLMLEKGENKDWFDSRLIVTLAIVAGAVLLLFIWHELRTARPAVDLSLLENRSFAAATAVGGVLGLGLYASLFILPLFLQTILGYSAYESGLALMPRSLAMAAGMPIAGRLYNRMGPRSMVIIGLFVSTYSFWDLSRMTAVTIAIQCRVAVSNGVTFSARIEKYRDVPGVARAAHGCAKLPRRDWPSGAFQQPPQYAPRLASARRHEGGSLATLLFPRLSPGQPAFEFRHPLTGVSLPCPPTCRRSWSPWRS